MKRTLALTAGLLAVVGLSACSEGPRQVTGTIVSKHYSPEQMIWMTQMMPCGKNSLCPQQMYIDQPAEWTLTVGKRTCHVSEPTYARHQVGQQVTALECDAR